MKILLLFILFGLGWSCAKDGAEKDQAAASDSLKVAQSSEPTDTELRLGDTLAAERMPNASEIPIGKLPLLHSSVLAQFHPRPEGFVRYRSLAYDSVDRGESVSFFRSKNDSAHLIRCIIVDQNEQTASTLIKQIIEVKALGFRDFDLSEGKKMRVYYTEINGMPALHGVHPERNYATVNILCGDHRLVLFREDKARTTDHLISIAKTMDLRRLSEIVPQ